MPFNIEDCCIHVVRPPSGGQGLDAYAKVFRELRLQALRDDPESFTETYDEVSSRPQSFWEDFLLQQRGLVHIAFCVPQRDVPEDVWTHKIDKDAWIIQNGTAHAMAVNTGPLSATRFLGWPDSLLPPTRVGAGEFKVHADMLFLSPAVRGRAGGNVKKLLEVDRDMWLLDQLKAAGTNPPPIARLRGNVKAGRNQDMLLRFYVKSGWFIAGRQTFAANLLAKSGPEGVEMARKKGYRMDEVAVVIEKIFTVTHLEWQIKETMKVLKKTASTRKAQL